MQFFAAKRANLQTFPSGQVYIDVRFSSITVQAMSLNMANGIVRHHAVPVISSLAVPLWIVIDGEEIVVVADSVSLPGVEIIVRASDGSSRILPPAETVWSVGVDTLSSDLAHAVASLTRIAS